MEFQVKEEFNGCMYPGEDTFASGLLTSDLLNIDTGVIETVHTSIPFENFPEPPFGKCIRCRRIIASGDQCQCFLPPSMTLDDFMEAETVIVGGLSPSSIKGEPMDEIDIDKEFIDTEAIDSALATSRLTPANNLVDMKPIGPGISRPRLIQGSRVPVTSDIDSDSESLPDTRADDPDYQPPKYLKKKCNRPPTPDHLLVDPLEELPGERVEAPIDWEEVYTADQEIQHLIDQKNLKEQYWELVYMDIRRMIRKSAREENKILEQAIKKRKLAIRRRAVKNNMNNGRIVKKTVIELCTVCGRRLYNLRGRGVFSCGVCRRKTCSACDHRCGE